MALSRTQQTAFTDFVGSVAAVQSSYRSTRSRYFQGLRTTADPTRQTVSPDPSYAEVGLVPPPGMAVQIDVYRAPGGWGYVVGGTATDIGGVVWTRSVNSGPETWRDSGGWVLVEVEG
jgi:hypothetical protein